MTVRMLCLALCLSGCAATVPKQMRLGELKSGADLQLPLAIELQPGDVLPLYLSASGPLFELADAPPVDIRIKRHFFVILREDGPPRLSLDGVTPLERGGSFRFGLGSSKERGPHAELGVEMRELEGD